MITFRLNAKNFTDAESMAAAYLAAYFGDSEIKYPISPFKMLKDEGVDFVIRNFYKLEGHIRWNVSRRTGKEFNWNGTSLGYKNWFQSGILCLSRKITGS